MFEPLHLKKYTFAASQAEKALKMYTCTQAKAGKVLVHIFKSSTLIWEDLHVSKGYESCSIAVGKQVVETMWN